MITIFSQYLIWHFSEVCGNIIKAWGDFLKFNLNYFSIPLLLKTFFSHWRRYKMSYGRRFDIGRYFEAFVFNMFSRSVGAILRFFFIFIGLIFQIFIFFLGIIILSVWLTLPLLLIIGLIFDLKFLIT